MFNQLPRLSSYLSSAHPVYAHYSPSPLPQLAIRRKQPRGQQNSGYYSDNHNGNLITAVVNGLLCSILSNAVHTEGRRGEKKAHRQRYYQRGLDAGEHGSHRESHKGGFPRRPLPVPKYQHQNT